MANHETPELDFTPWPKTFRVNRDMIVTEKIDGTNAAVRVIAADALGLPVNPTPGVDFYKHRVVEDSNGRLVLVGAQSRKKLITPGKQSDNAAFAAFVFDNAQSFADLLGEGIHFGEWYGPAIQSNLYGISEKRFMLFNTTRWGAPEFKELLRGRFNDQVEVATVLYEGPFNTNVANAHVDILRNDGSVHVPESDYAEGVIVHHVPSQVNFKITLEKDEQPKGISGA